VENNIEESMNHPEGEINSGDHLCRVCGSGRLVPKWEVGKYRVVGCLDCTAMLVDNAPTLQELEEHYAKVSDPAYYEANRHQLCYYYDKLASMIRRLRPEGKRIFDVGCSRGWFLGSMKGWECHGNEINEFEAGEARKIAGDRIIQGPFESCPDYAEPFDVVTIQDVLDHFIDPVAVVQKASRMLPSGGLLVIKVHDFDCLWARLTGKKFYAVIPPDHLTYFTRKSLKVLCEKNGFSVIKQAHYSQAITIPTIFFRLSHSNRDSFFGRIHTALEHSFLKKVTIRKNLHDIITIFAVKK
jgi:SAM-dependent methyltransferase